MQMGHAERVQGFVSNMQHAQVWTESLRMSAKRGQAYFRRIGTSARQDVLHALEEHDLELTLLFMQAVQELNMRMAHAQEVQGFVANMQHAQVREVTWPLSF